MYIRLPSVAQQTMKVTALLRSIRVRPALPATTIPLQYRSFQHDFLPRDPKAKPKRYKYPLFYNPYGPKPPLSYKLFQLVEQIANLSPDERSQIGPTLEERLKHPKLTPISTEGMDMGLQGGREEKNLEKTAFDVKLEK